MSKAQKTTRKPKHPQPFFGLAALSVALGQDVDVIQLLPAGKFRSTDGSGRPEDVESWQLDAEIAKHVIEQFNERGQKCVIDYEHQTLNTEQNGQPAPAAGWIKKLVWRDTGLYAAVKWTARAKQYIDAEEYLYISPVFSYDERGRPLAIFHAALTNNPALTGMDEVRLAAAKANYTKDYQTMNEFLKRLLVLLGLSEDASEEEIDTAFSALEERLATLTSDEEKKEAELTSKEEELAELNSKNEELEQELAALRAGKVDPKKYVPVAALTALQAQVNKLSKSQTDKEVDDVVNAALAAGKLIPALEPWARDLGTKDIAALRAYVDATAPIAALGAKQSTTVKVGATEQSLSPDEMAICRATGVSPKDFAAQRVAEKV